ncbi:class I SAM-dependent methyltransferase [Rhizobium sp. P40RR-XXII]|uniref:class I SAM-dependent methyltransferase n=1 Tax=unclassified Rhizobium TaxID=2613769 RepID=UPI0014565E19|nr:MULTISPECIES: class I SAM-dependent methyltransferase [unclassified Rhizobium]NLR87126.1 class I SAM-dependent methyltransferase [Rhizobium sp. P28RR-XV]NLS17853.1 class I SAM-dependent methyltransferase [Rhizobium sp. P40RR-XXII]
MPQNIYNEPIFFEGYKKLRLNDTGINGALEVPALRAALPDLAGLRVLDMGCGFGDFARYARSCGAASVTGLDVSENMIAEARVLTNDSQIEYLCGSIEEIAFPPESFDLVVSSMAIHYVNDYASMVLSVHACLPNKGQFIFSVEHPVCTANPVGWTKDADGNPLNWPLDNYQTEGIRHTKWFIDGVEKYHRTVETYVTTLLRAGFRLNHLGEPSPLPEFLNERPALSINLRRPAVLLLAAAKMAFDD